MIGVEDLPTGARLTDPDALTAIEVAAGAPPPLGTAIEQVDVLPGQPIEVLLRGGVRLLFGDDSELDQKWTAVAAVLADAGGEGLSLHRCQSSGAARRRGSERGRREAVTDISATLDLRSRYGQLSTGT